MNVDLQKAGLWKRIAAAILDFILLSIVAVGACWALNAVLGYDAHMQHAESIKTAYEQEYGIPSDANRAEMSAEEQKAYDDAVAKANEALAKDPEAIKAITTMQNLMLIIPTFGILLAILLLEFVVPLLFKNGATVGKFVFGLGLVRADCVRINPLQLFTRALLGKYTIETMIPVYLAVMIFNGSLGIMGLAVIAGILLLQVILYFATRTHSLIHDLMAGTVVVDAASQRIFANDEERIAFSKRLAAEKAERQAY